MHQLTYENPEEELAARMGALRNDPLGFVMYAFPWGEGELKGFPGPVKWQADFLSDLGDEISKRNFDRVHAVPPIREATASGHGIGKSALTAWLMLFLMSTRPFCRGVVTANTGPQLATKTWAELRRWTARAINSHWFEVRSGIGSLRLAHRDFPETWRVDGLTCREENSEAFAGLHAVNSTPFYIFDEASAIPEAIWEVANGGLTDGEPMWFVFGNPTRNTGSFRECFGRMAHRWNTRQIDSRDVPLTNKALLDEWVEDHGEDSDFVRVRVRGVFPKASDMQFISSQAVADAMRRDGDDGVMVGEPLILGIDLARGGSDKTVLMWRAGRCARPCIRVPQPIILSGEQSRDSMRVVSVIVQAIEDTKPDAIFLDATGGSIGGPIADRLGQLGFRVNHVGFSEACPHPAWKAANMRAYMWMRMRQWIVDGGGALWRNLDLEADLTSPEYAHNSRDELLLESKESLKKRGLASPDLADALALTFAANVPPLVGRPRWRRTRHTAVL